jgi:hypothetical protein
MKPGVLWALAGLLAAGVAAELVWPQSDGAGSVVPRAPQPVLAAAAAPENVGAWSAAILARPLFEPGRRPIAAATEARVAASRQEPPRLTGILVTAQGSHAIFAGEGEHSTIAGEGAKLGAWQVVAIRPGEVQMTGPDGDRIVRPSFANAPAALSAQPQTDTRPFNMIAQPSGAQIFSNTPALPGARTPP